MSFFFFRSRRLSPASIFFFFNDTATTEIYTLSLHDALPISGIDFSDEQRYGSDRPPDRAFAGAHLARSDRGCTTKSGDRKSTRLNSSHQIISYAVFCLKKKKKKKNHIHTS